MGKKPADIEREIAEQRRQIERKINDAGERIRSDAREARTRVKTRVSERTQIDRYVEERPLTTMLGAFGAGVMMGMASDKLMPRGSTSDDGHRRVKRRPEGGTRDGLLSGLMGSASGIVGNELADELRDMVRSVLGDGGQASQRREAPETLFRSQYEPETYDGDRHATGTVRSQGSGNGRGPSR